MFQHQGAHMNSRMFSSEQRSRLTQLVNEGIQVLTEIDDLNTGLNETVRAVAEEMEIKPGVLKRAIRIAAKSRLSEINRDNTELNDILETVGRTL